MGEGGGGEKERQKREVVRGKMNINGRKREWLS